MQEVLVPGQAIHQSLCLGTEAGAFPENSWHPAVKVGNITSLAQLQRRSLAIHSLYLSVSSRDGNEANEKAE